MDFEAYYTTRSHMWRGLAGAGFILLGFWILTWPTAEFEGIGGSGRRSIASLSVLFGVSVETVGRAVGLMGLFIGIAALRILILNLRHKGPAIRVNADGIYCHRLSEQHIPWSNVANIEFYSQQGQKTAHITLIDRQEPSFLRKLGQACGILNSSGFRLTVRDTDGDYDDMVESLLSHTRAS